MFGIPSHFLVIHFALVLIIGALYCDLKGHHEAGYRCTMWAAAAAVLAILTGLIQVGGQVAAVSTHAAAGIGGGILTVILGVMRYSRRARGEESGSYPQTWLLVETLAALAIIVAAITGHRAVLGY